MSVVTEEKIYTLHINDEELNKLNNGESFEVEINKNKIVIVVIVRQ